MVNSIVAFGKHCFNPRFDTLFQIDFVVEFPTTMHHQKSNLLVNLQVDYYYKKKGWYVIIFREKYQFMFTKQNLAS